MRKNRAICVRYLVLAQRCSPCNGVCDFGSYRRSDVLALWPKSEIVVTGAVERAQVRVEFSHPEAPTTTGT